MDADLFDPPASPKSQTETAVEGFLAAIYADPELGPRMRETDAIEAEVQDCVFAVDLGIAFSPVLMNAGDDLEAAVEVAYEAEDGRYLIREPYRLVPPEELKVMRARYLVMRGKANQPRLDAFLKRFNPISI